MRKRMKKKFVAICISLAITLTGPGMSMVTMTYADEITKENQQDQEISNDQNNTKDGENSNTNDGKETENDLIQGNDSDSPQEKAEENITEAAPEAEETPGYENDEPDYEDEEIAGYMDGDDDTGRATGVSFDELGEAVRTANADNPTETEKRQAAGTLASIEGTNLYDAVVENINGGLAKVAELLGRNEAELATAAVPAEAGNTSKEHEAFDMNDFL